MLASASPRRAEILERLGLAATIEPAGIREARFAGEAPAAYVERLARAKASCVLRRVAGNAPGDEPLLVVGGDTVVVHRERLLGKPANTEEAVEMLTRLAGDWHEVFTATAVTEANGSETRTESGTAVSRVRFRPFGEAFARDYVATGEPMDKAGAYGVQRLGAALVERIEGDFHAVMGLPVTLFLEVLERLGWRYDFRGLRR